MELIDEKQKRKAGRGKRTVGISIMVLVIVLIILISVILALLKMDNDLLKLNINGKRYNMPTNLMINTEDGNTYIAISLLANYVGYEFYNGEYKEYTENKNKGYVECKEEVASFSAGSNLVYKNNSEDKLNFDTYVLSSPIITYNDRLYVNMQDVGVLFDSVIFYRGSDHTLVVQTMPYLISYYKTQLKKYGYDGIVEDFITQKAVVYGMLVVKKEETFGVVQTKDFSRIIGTRYDSIKFLESTQEFIVSSEGKSGLISKTGETKIDLRYDEIGLIDTQNKLYYAKNNELMGVLNGNGKVIVYMEYTGLGVDRAKFPYDGIKHNMLLYGNCIPTMKTERKQVTNDKGEIIVSPIYKWGLADKIGNILLNAEYDNLGYYEKESKDRSINNVIVVPSVNGIVFGKGGKYGIINSLGRIVIPCEFDKIYSITNEGEDEFYLEQSGRTYKLERYITDNKIVITTPDEKEKYEGDPITGIIPNENTNNNTVNGTTNNTVTNGVTNNIMNTTTGGNTIKNTVPVSNNVITTVVM